MILSCEFFPPKTPEGMEKLRVARDQLATMKPHFFSVTFGAGGSTQERTFETVTTFQRETGITCAPHLSCIGSTRAKIAELLQNYQTHGIHHIVALRGDMPSGMRDPGELKYANELVAFIRAETDAHFHIEVAAYPEVHPQAHSAREDLIHFKRKIDAGAQGALTQYFFNVDAYTRFVTAARALEISVPIVPGIMPITNYVQLARFSDACGAEIPRWLRWRLQDFGNDLEGLRAFGLEVTTQLCRDLLAAGAPGLHFYTMNQAPPTLTIWKNLGITASTRLPL